MKTSRRGCLALVYAALGATGAFAQDYPTRTITVIVPFPPGGASDVVARVVGDHMSRTLGQQMVIENVGGAGGTFGSGRVAAACRGGPKPEVGGDYATASLAVVRAGILSAREGRRVEEAEILRND